MSGVDPISQQGPWLQLLHYLYDADVSRGQTIGKISSNFVSPLDLTNVRSAFDADLICLNFCNFELSSGRYGHGKQETH